MRTMLGQEQHPGMILPVTSHIERLASLIDSIDQQTAAGEKDLQILRGTIIQLSYINKSADQQLNEFVVDNIASLKSKWEEEWESNIVVLAECRKKLGKLWEEHEDIEVSLQEVQEKVDHLERIVGLTTS